LDGIAKQKKFILQTIENESRKNSRSNPTHLEVVLHSISAPMSCALCMRFVEDIEEFFVENNTFISAVKKRMTFIHFDGITNILN
jgi:hypothetical protein